VRLWIDDSGEKEYGEKTSRFFVYCGVAVERALEDQVVESFNAMKELLWGTTLPEAKSNWLRRPDEWARRYKEPYGLLDEEIGAFSRSFYRWLNQQPLTILAAVVDKELMMQKYGGNAHYPSATAYEFLLQRYQMFLKDRRIAEGEVVMDDTAGRTPKGRYHRDLLIKQHQQIIKHGSRLVTMRLDRVADRIKIGGSHHYPLLQVADLCAYNVMRQFRAYPDTNSLAVGAPVPMYEYFARILPKFRCAPSGRVDGYGVVKHPKG
jgi:hypothetical protein